MFTVLFTSIGRRVELLRSFSRNPKIRVVGTDASLLAPAAYACHKFYKVVPFDNSAYIEMLLKICSNESVHVVIPLHEREFLLLLHNKSRFEDLGVKLLLSSEVVIETCEDKYETYLFFREHGINTPDTFLREEIRQDDIGFPLFIKPRRGMGSKRAFKLNNRRELDFFLDYVEDPIIQCFIEGIEYTVDVLCDLKGNVISAVPRERIEVRDGEINKGRTVKNWRIIDASVEVAHKLGGIGPLTIQCIVTSVGDIFFIEINPRFGGGVPLSITAGVDYPELIRKMVEGDDIEPQIGCFQDNLYMLRYNDSIFKNKEELYGF